MTANGPWPAPLGLTITRVTTARQLAQCWEVRREVFVDEQRVPIEEELDAADTAPSTTHLLVTDEDDVALATARILSDDQHPGEVHIGRMAVRSLVRGAGLGHAVMAACHDIALHDHGVDIHHGWEGREHSHAQEDCHRQVTVRLSAQDHAVNFYRSLGYEQTSQERYLDAGIWHYDMARTITEAIADHNEPSEAESTRPAAAPALDDLDPNSRAGRRARRAMSDGGSTIET